MNQPRATRGRRGIGVSEPAYVSSEYEVLPKLSFYLRKTNRCLPISITASSKWRRV
jgi:hypothetical protein